ncbi:MAG: hypothetical protein INF50_06905 [Rhodobacter sp.]|nr:hypothetical protein [Rhodobacter sp.]
MPEVNNYSFDLREVTELLVRSAGVTEGHWMLNVNMTFSVGNFQTAPDTGLPGALVSFQSVGLSKVDPATSPPNLTVDASKLSGADTANK